MTSFYNLEELSQIGFKSYGKNVLISRKASLYGVERMEFGDHVRIDDFCFLSAGAGGISLGSHIHVSAYASLVGQGRIVMEDYSCVSSRVAVYSSSDDYSGMHMTNPMVPEKYTGVIHADVILRKHVLVGCGSVILPGVTLEEGSAVGALSLVNRDSEAFWIYSGNPAKKLKERSRNLLELEQEFQNDLTN